ncbi:MAG: shikimate dehydrogenase [Firmicutes bacterium]|nr:shikimate dehydrogenase [Bacillota bacterium]
MITGSTRVVGLLGHPVRHSLSPIMHNAGFQAAGLDWVYIPFPTAPEHLEEVLAGLYHVGVAGLNVTVPHKVAVVDHLAGLTEEALRIGAVNLLIPSPQGWIGDNTDGQGFIRALTEAGFEAEGKRVLLLGAGGAARAVAHALLAEGAAGLVISNRTWENAKDLEAELDPYYSDAELDIVPWKERNDPGLLMETDLIVNTTVVGMHAKKSDPPLLHFSELSSDHRPFVADIVYTPLETPLVREAKKHGLPVLTGEKMLLYQGVMSWEAWTGQPAPIQEMVKALVWALER